MNCLRLPHRGEVCFSLLTSRELPFWILRLRLGLIRLANFSYGVNELWFHIANIITNILEALL